MNTIAELLREGRKNKELTQYQVMIALGFKSMDRISKWEHGVAEPGAKNLMKLVALYNISLDKVQECMQEL